jgi:hypothetical protein
MWADDALFQRHATIPILSGNDWPYPVNSVFNAGEARLPDGDTLLLCRVEDRQGLSHLCAARCSCIPRSLRQIPLKELRQIIQNNTLC